MISVLSWLLKMVTIAFDDNLSIRINAIALDDDLPITQKCDRTSLWWDKCDRLKEKFKPIG